MKYYSEYGISTGRFTSACIGTGEGIPEAQPGFAWWGGAIDHAAFVVDVAQGVLVEFSAPPDTTAAAVSARVARDALLAACDWVMRRADDRGEPYPPAWVAYREALRAVPEQPGFPTDIDWPKPP